MRAAVAAAGCWTRCHVCRRFHHARTTTTTSLQQRWHLHVARRTRATRRVAKSLAVFHLHEPRTNHIERAPFTAVCLCHLVLIVCRLSLPVRRYVVDVVCRGDRDRFPAVQPLSHQPSFFRHAETRAGRRVAKAAPHNEGPWWPYVRSDQRQVESSRVAFLYVLVRHSFVRFFLFSA